MDDWHGWQPKERSPLVLHTNKHVEWEIPSVITGWYMSQWRFSRTGISQGSSLGQDSAWWCNDAVATDAKDKSILSVSVGFLDFDDLLSPTLLRVWRTNEGLSCEARYVPAAVNRSHLGRPFFLVTPVASLWAKSVFQQFGDCGKSGNPSWWFGT